MSNKSIMSALTVAISLILILPTQSQAAKTNQQNAADIYQKAIKLYQPDSAIRRLITDYTKGASGPNEAILGHIKANQKVIDLVIRASKIQYCKWDVELAPLDPYGSSIDNIEPYFGNVSKIKKLSELVLADARACIHSGNFNEAIERCMTVYGICRHIDAKPTMGFLIMTFIESRTTEVVTDILGQADLDNDALKSLKVNITKYIRYRTTFIQSLDFEKSYYLKFIDKLTPEQTKDQIAMNMNSLNDDNLSQIFKEKCDYINFGSDYYVGHQEHFRNIIQKSYQQAYPELIELSEKAVNDGFTIDEKNKRCIVNCGAFMTALTSSTANKTYGISVKANTNFNALLCAIDLYVTKQTTGKLPDKLPPNSPKDPFSNKDFIYKKNTDGFILTCQGKDIKRNKTHQWDFKIHR